MLILSILLIWRFSNGKFRKFGFNLKLGSGLREGLLVGVFFGILMTVIDLTPSLLTGKFSLSYEPTLINVVGRLSYIWIFAGLNEEILFRGLIQTELSNLEDNIRYRGFKKGTIVTALIYALSHLGNLSSRTFLYVSLQIIYTLFLGLALGKIYQRTGRLIGPIIGHNLANGIEYTIEYLLYFLVSV
jgi:membrane protease YdiL (CAAX protease family)